MGVLYADGQYIEGDAPRIFAPNTDIKGVFDTLLAVKGAPQDASPHYARLVHDVESVLGYPQSVIPTLEELQAIWQELLSRNDLSKGHARVRTLVADHIITISAESAPAPETLQAITCAIIRDYPRIAGDEKENCKRADYTRSFKAREKAKIQGAEEAIITNTRGDIACGAVSNIFIKEGNILVTPPLSDGVLAGITRAKIIQESGAREESIDETRLRAADEIYLTNSVQGMRPISAIIS